MFFSAYFILPSSLISISISIFISTFYLYPFCIVLSYLYIYFVGGEGVKQDYGKALSLFSLSAQQGSLVALYNLAQMHQHGLGTVPSCTLAVQLYKKVAERGRWSASIHEAYKLYQRGEYAAALYRYEQAAQQGYEVAQSNAAYMYDKGLGVAKEIETNNQKIKIQINNE